MWTKIKFFLLAILVFFIFSCEKRKHSAYDIFIVNNSSSEYIVEYDKLPNKDTVINAESNNDNGRNLVYLINVEYIDDIRNRYTEAEFEQEVSSLKVYYLSATNEKIYYGGSEDYCQKLSNWEYDYSEDDNFGMHDYILRIRDE